MADSRLFRTSITYWLAFPEAFADWQNPTADEMANTDLVFNITCAVCEDGTNFDVDASDTDDSLSFCQQAGSVSPTFYNPNIALQIFRSADPLEVNTANTALGLLNYPDIEYFSIMRVGPEPDAAVAIGDRLKMARTLTDNPVDVIDAGSNEELLSAQLAQGDVNWGYIVAA